MYFKTTLLTIALAVPVLAHASALQPSLGQDKSSVPAEVEAKFLSCQHEAFQSYFIGMGYFQAKQRGESFKAYDKAADTKRRIDRLRQGDKAGEFKSHSDFAAAQLYDCAKKEGLRAEQPIDIARVCFARVDIPVYLINLKKSGASQEAAVAQVIVLLNNSNIHPRALIELIADMVYAYPKSENAEMEMMRMVFWTCYGRAELNENGEMSK